MSLRLKQDGLYALLNKSCRLRRKKIKESWRKLALKREMCKEWQQPRDIDVLVLQKQLAELKPQEKVAELQTKTQQKSKFIHVLSSYVSFSFI